MSDQQNNPSESAIEEVSSVEIPCVDRPVVGSITPPGSKSITNRALVCSALANGTSHLSGVLNSEDTHVMAAAWNSAGVNVEVDWDGHQAKIDGIGGSYSPDSDSLLPSSHSLTFIDVINSGTSIRFLAAALAACGGTFTLDGIPRMRQRPIGDLVKSLQSLGCNISCQENQFPPVAIQPGRMKGGKATVAGNISSQFLSGLLMAAPLSKNTVELEIEGELVSRPYVEMTLAVMKSFGVEVEQGQNGSFQINPGPYTATDYSIEPDASAASYFWAAAAITKGSVTVDGLTKKSLQGDVDFVDCLEKMGCQIDYLPNGIRVTGGELKGIDVDMSNISDTVQTLAAVALFADGPTTVSGIEHNRHKETDRIEDLATELRKLGATVDCRRDGMTITPGVLKPAEIKTYNDHRMAMSLSLVGLRQPGIKILDPGCTRKTYPNYFEDLFQLTTSGSDF